MSMKIEWVSTGSEKHGGGEYEEITVRDNRGMIVGYALLDPREPGYEQERKATLAEFRQDFGK